ncbi:MAG: hypothetical protein K2Y42_06340 [Hyphomicrobium sp.]|jgi:hypothetical protein|uniref:hypothetical protein n=1 Tax=Hyphomicrobium sp. TaxID=82 RepID=UPI0025B98DF0|nr:hypothetical protein [Hyphomicrobium sp.]MBX9862356.1 hypothetical protein [Hyphomicrobium sp.]
MKISPALILGLVIGVATFTFIKRASMFGIECFHTGKEFLPNTPCIEPSIYYGLLGFAALLTIVGIIRTAKGTPAKPEK